jgi:hypothetical protein
LIVDNRDHISNKYTFVDAKLRRDLGHGEPENIVAREIDV